MLRLALSQHCCRFRAARQLIRVQNATVAIENESMASTCDRNESMRHLYAGNCLERQVPYRTDALGHKPPHIDDSGKSDDMTGTGTTSWLHIVPVSVTRMQLQDTQSRPALGRSTGNHEPPHRCTAGLVAR